MIYLESFVAYNTFKGLTLTQNIDIRYYFILYYATCVNIYSANQYVYSTVLTCTLQQSRGYLFKTSTYKLGWTKNGCMQCSVFKASFNCGHCTSVGTQPRQYLADPAIKPYPLQQLLELFRADINQHTSMPKQYTKTILAIQFADITSSTYLAKQSGIQPN